jgi:NTP pyrophosphatase (non-canonical NTP hydrolase)
MRTLSQNPQGNEMSDTGIDLKYVHFQQSFAAIAADINEWAERKGWNEDDPTRWLVADHPTLNAHRESAIIAHDISKVALMGTELAEAIEGIRHGNPPSDKIGDAGFNQVEEELADTIIRIAHFAAQRGYRVGEALIAKLAYNEKRPYKHGKLA